MLDIMFFKGGNMTTKQWTGFTVIGHFETKDGKTYDKNLNCQISDRCAEEIEYDLDDILQEIISEEKNYGSDHDKHKTR